jgi:hypothetical protein
MIGAIKMLCVSPRLPVVDSDSQSDISACLIENRNQKRVEAVSQ